MDYNWFFFYYEFKRNIYPRPPRRAMLGFITKINGSMKYFSLQWTWFDDFVIFCNAFFNDDIVDDHDNYLYFVLNCFVVEFYDTFSCNRHWSMYKKCEDMNIYHGQLFHFIYCQLITRSLTLCPMMLYFVHVKNHLICSSMKTFQEVEH